MIREWLKEKFGSDPVSLNLEAKALSDASFFPITHGDNTILPRTKFNYSQHVGDGLGSSVLMSPIKWIQRNFPDAPLCIVDDRKEESQILKDHALLDLINIPNPHYSGTDLFSSTLYSFIVDGNAYWRIERGAMGQPIGLWYTPHWLMDPAWPKGGDVFISHYNYSSGNGRAAQVLSPEDVVHFRNGINPRNSRKGLSLIESELREIFTDDEAANMIASLCRNMGVPGLMVSPDAEEPPDDFDVDAYKRYLLQNFTRDARGEPLVSNQRMKVQQFGFDPKSMELSNIRNIPEERVCAALGIPAAVIGFGTGLETTKVGATMNAFIRLAWDGGLTPIQNNISAKITQQLLPEFEPDPKKMKANFDTSQVDALQENRGAVADVATKLVAGGLITRAEGRAMVGESSGPADDVFLMPMNVVEVPATGLKSMEIPPQVEELLKQIIGDRTKALPAPPDVNVNVAPAQVKVESPTVNAQPIVNVEVAPG